MARRDFKGEKLRKALETAIDKDRLKDVITSLRALEEHEPREPRWPQRLGDALKRAGQTTAAEGAYVRAMNIYSDEGFLPQAVALGKVVVALNPERAGLLDGINQEATRNYRAAPPPPSTQPSPPRSVAAVPREPPRDHPSFLGGIPRAGIAAAATPLEPAADSGVDEIRFEDVSPSDSIWIDVSDLDAMAQPDDDTDVAAVDFEFAEPLDASRLSQLSGAALFADVSQEALGALARGAELLELGAGDAVCRQGDEADSIFIIVEGAAHVALPRLDGGGVDLAAGQVFGEACLLQGGKRMADVDAKSPLTLLRIPAVELQRIVAVHGEVHEVLFDLLVKRLVTNTLQTSSLFAAFDPDQRKDLGRLFEVRLAPEGCILQQRGKRSDGLYLLLVGGFFVSDGDQREPLPYGSLIGHRSLLSRDAASQTVIASSESIVLRMPAGRFSSFAMQFPPALALLTDLAAQPLLG